MIVCHRCGKENQDHYKFCLGCGGGISATPGPLTPVEAVPAGGEPEPAPPQADDALGDVPGDAALGGAATATSETSVSGGEASGPAPTPSEPATTDSGPVEGATRACPGCGRISPVDFAFCGGCGMRMDVVAATPSSRAAASSPDPEAEAAPARLVLILPDGGEGGSLALREGETVVGRDGTALFEGDAYLSPRHAVLELRDGSLVVRDDGSLNGVFVKMSGEERIDDGEVFRLGQELLRFEALAPGQPLDDGTEIMGSPNPGYWGRVTALLGRDQDGAAYPIAGDSAVIGRERGDILFPDDGYVSGAHARLSRRDDGYYLADLNSSNGTFLRLRGERALRDGSFLLLGQQLFRVSL